MREGVRHKSRLLISLISLTRTLFAFVELFIVARIILDFFEASSSALFVRWVENITNPLLAPFVGIFPDIQLDKGFTLATHALLALGVYAFVGYIIEKLLGLLALHRSLWQKEERPGAGR